MSPGTRSDRPPAGWRVALDRLLPPSCVLCARGLPAGRAPLCDPCRHRLTPLPPPWCARCGAPAGRGGACPECEGWEEERPRCVSVYPMAGGPAGLVHALKYGGWEALARPMAGAMVPAVHRLVGAIGAADEGPVLVPVPLSAARLRERGFNQAQLLARHLARRTGWPLEPVLRRRRTGTGQVRAGRRERAANVSGGFTSAPGGARAVRGRRVVLVDDVVTTGETVAACARALHRAGSSSVGVVSFARTLYDPNVDRRHP